MSLAHGMVFQNYDPRAQYFNKVIDVAREAGLINYFFGKWKPDENVKIDFKVQDKTLRAEHFLLPSVVSAFGLTLALLSFLLETLLHKIHQYKRLIMQNLWF